MKLHRRQFLRAGTAALLGSATAARASTPASIASALAEAGFQPGTPGHALLAVAADLHINVNPDNIRTEFESSLVNELNSLDGLTDLVLAGDTITSHSNAAGQPRYPTAYANARQELRIARQQLRRFSSGYRLWVVPGNHDTDNQETTPDLWMAELGFPSNRRLDLGGVPVFLLNSGHSGTLDSAQKNWFLAQVAEIPRDQEVVIVCHHPSFLYIVGETGVKKIVAAAFAGWQAPVYLVGGHGHAHAHRITHHKGTRFLQMQVTSGTVTSWSDENSPGYILLAMAGGRVLARVFRSVALDTSQIAPTEATVPATRLDWPFDYVPFPARTWETDGDRHGLVAHTANDLKTHFGYTGELEWSFDMTPYGGKATEFVLLASIASNVRGTTRVSFAASGPDAVWLEREVGLPDPGAVYRIPIPEALRAEATLRVRFATSLPPYAASITVGGWGFASDAGSLTGYERWCATHYRTFLPTAETAPDRIPPGQNLSNLQLFAFNQPVPEVAAPGLWHSATGGSSMIPEPPALQFAVEKVNDFRFRRRRLPAHAGIVYRVEVSGDLVNWSVVPENELLLDPAESADWEIVTVRRTAFSSRSWYFRVGVQPLPGTEGDYQDWLASLPGNPANPEDQNRNGRNDLFEFAFDASLPATPIHPLPQGHPGVSEHGLPMVTSARVRLPVLRFTRMREAARPGVRYVLEFTENMRDWRDYPAGLQAERWIEAGGDYETVEIVCVEMKARSRFYRIRVETPGP